jgi:Amt family ammonium transporter
VGGTIGAILTGVFCSSAVNSAAQDGLIFGNASQMLPQLAGVGATWLYAGLMSAVLLFIVDKITGLRVKSTEEDAGLDLTQHGEEGYVF